ncbi:phage antirepressor N-terminal domain-containing protein [Delftia acidovorans]|uniref:phage antirepressor N-terminal domain-containing protein n=1 Tax=Delftia acidovorans TaxID=80866 RepID=UPI00286F22DB|nr:phage antirepressor N-terminal domain-containing protein [Delftia acidovorans]
MPHEAEKGNAPEGRSFGALSEETSQAMKGIIMSDSTQVSASRAITVPFHGAELYVVDYKGQPYTPMKPIVEGIGLDWKSQHAKLSGNPGRWGMVEITIPSEGGMQAMACIALRKLFGWLAGIHVGKIKEAIRPSVLTYQNECDDVLWRHWNDGAAPRNSMENGSGQMSLDYDRISPAQAQDLREIVQAIVDAGIQKHPETWARFQRKFRVNSYLELPAARHTEARQYLIAKLPQGYAPNIAEEPAQPAGWSPERVNSALSLVAEVMPHVSRAIFDAVMTGQNWQADRFMLSFDVNTRGLVAQAKKIDSNAYVMPMDRFYDAIETSMSVEPAVLARLAATCANRLGSMAGRLPAASGA